MTAQELTPQQLGPYQLLRQLGEGGMGVVYLAQDSAERLVAVKALRHAGAADPNARRRLAREVETMRRVQSPYVAEVIDADLEGDTPYIVTRYVPGRTLDDIVAETGALTGPALARLGCGLAAALTAVHAAGVVHRDLKPGNVMMLDGEPVVIDFGIAQAPEATRITMTGMFMGTPGYLAPEVIEGKQSGPAADVHSWGATMAFAATGRPPFGTGSFETIFYRIINGQPDLVQAPATLAPVLVRALARDPSRRPTAAELGALTAAIDPATLLPAPPNGGAGGAAGLPGPIGQTALDLPAHPVSPAGPFGAPVGQVSAPGGTHPFAVAGSAGPVVAGSAGAAGGQAGDFRDLLPPVNYAPSAGRVAAPSWSPPGYPVPAGSAAARPPRSAWSPLVIAAVAAAVAVSVLLPLAGAVAMLAVLILLRAGDLTGGRLSRRARRGSRPAGFLLGLLYFPLALCRSLLRFVLLAPVGLLAAGLVAAITIIMVPMHPLPRAFSYGVGTMIAFYGLGPGSGASRRPLGRILGVTARTSAVNFVIFVVVGALAVAAVLTAASQPPIFWPVTNLSHWLGHMPTLHGVINDIRLTLLRLAGHIGL
jgi:Protein kinase domain